MRPEAPRTTPDTKMILSLAIRVASFGLHCASCSCLSCFGTLKQEESQSGSDTTFSTSSSSRTSIDSKRRSANGMGSSSRSTTASKSRVGLSAVTLMFLIFLIAPVTAPATPRTPRDRVSVKADTAPSSPFLERGVGVPRRECGSPDFRRNVSRSWDWPTRSSLFFLLVESGRSQRDRMALPKCSPVFRTSLLPASQSKRSTTTSTGSCPGELAVAKDCLKETSHSGFKVSLMTWDRKTSTTDPFSVMTRTMHCGSLEPTTSADLKCLAFTMRSSNSLTRL
mmetsp:Transcript_96381/g.201366  ORF Transcript_96381/g.201366 Transcript_96381/m.201366 type:complete len:281 (+) Transcript_96381:1282-2124(+)